jgi:hypothetical protein
LRCDAKVLEFLSNMTKNKKTLFKFPTFKLSKKVLILVTIFSLILTGFGSFLVYREVTKPTEIVKAAGSSYGDGALYLDKVYCVFPTNNCASYTGSVTANPGQGFFVRLLYNNTSRFALTTATIRDNIPAGFSYAAGSTVNCYVDLPCTGLSDQNWYGGNTQLAVNPTAGYLGQPTFSSLGNLELGKLKYNYWFNCTPLGANSSGTLNEFANFSNNGAQGGGDCNRIGEDAAGNFGSTGSTFNFGGNYDVSAGRYVTYNACRVVSGSPAYPTNYQIAGYGNSALGSTCANHGYSSSFIGQAVYDHFGQRFATLYKCRGVQGNIFVNLNKIFYAPGPFHNNYDASPTTQAECDSTIGQSNNGLAVPAPDSGNYRSLDLADPGRGYGFIQYVIYPNASNLGGTFSGLEAGLENNYSPFLYSANGLSITVPPQPTAITATNTAGNSADCTSSVTVIIGTPKTCTFPLSGAANNYYILPTSGIVGNISTATGNSGACSIVNNQTATAKLSCGNIPTTSASAGSQNVNLFINGSTTPTPKGSLNLIPPSTTIAAANLTTSSDCTSANAVVIGNTTTCTFPLSGSAINDYTIPGTGILANIGTVATNSPACTITGNTTPAAALSCTAIPSVGGTPGVQFVNLLINGGAAVQKGTVSLVYTATVITNSNLTGNSSDCTSATNATVGNTQTCTFGLTGGAGNFYSLPSGGVLAAVDTATGTSAACTIINNSTASAALQCAGIPTAGGTAGVQNVQLYVNGSSTGLIRGALNLIYPTTVISSTNILTSTSCTSGLSVTIGNTYTCTFPVSGNSYGLYSLPSGGIVARTEQGGTTGGNSPACTLVATTLTCSGILSTSTPPFTVNPANVQLQFNATGGYTNSGIVSLVAPVTTISAGNINSSPDCITTYAVTIGTTFNCQFVLAGNSFGSYALPSGGIVARAEQTPNTTANSPACTLAAALLSCNNILTLGTPGVLIAGTANIGLQFNGAGGYSTHGVVTLNNAPIPPVTVADTNISNVLDCTSPTTVNIGTVFDCQFPLSGSTTNTYTLPSAGIKAKVASLNAQSDPCAIVNNVTPSASLKCPNIPTAGGTAGTQSVQLFVAASTTPTVKGAVNLLTVVTELNSGDLASLKTLTGFVCTPRSTLVSTKVSCTGTLPATKKAPVSGLRVRVEGQTNVLCVFASLNAGSSFSCVNLPVGALAGTYNVQAAIGAVANLENPSFWQQIARGLDVAAQSTTFTNTGETIIVTAAAVVAAPVLPRTGGAEIIAALVVLIGASAGFGYVIFKRKNIKTDLKKKTKK